MNESGSQPFRILTVCTGNICRSPMVERLLQANLDERFPGQFSVESAGTKALTGSPVDSRIAMYIQTLGGSTAHFSARQLTPEILKGQNLILTLTRDHRSEVVQMSPSVLNKTFTLGEFSRLMSEFTPKAPLRGQDLWRAAIPNLLRSRSRHHVDARLDDVVDPFRRPEEVYETMRLQIVSSMQKLFTLPA